ncbi:MAG: TGS domain-containing protein, partial [Clostridia bacterium]
MIKISLKGDVKEFESGISLIDVAKSISEGLARNTMCALVDGKMTDLRTTLTADCTVEFCNFDTDEGRHTFRHTASHIMAQAVKRLYPNIKLAIGPAIDNGFYYDFDADGALTLEDLPKIEEEMKKIVKENLPLEYFELPRAEAVKFMQKKDEPYKVELINDLPEDAVISFYKQGDFTDLCAGPHLMSTGAVKAFKLTGTAGAYWRGSEKNKMLTRIYATAFP